jgi:ATP-binding cassette subfamily B protein
VDLWFRYPSTDRDVLRGVDVSLPKGKVVALVGENGSGKTTLAKLLCGLYAPTQGAISWGDVEISQLDVHRLRASIAPIFQDFVRYPLSARENVSVGKAARAGDLEAVVSAARMAGADGFLSELPSGYSTLLAKDFPGGADLSGGQWQRVALARAFFRDAPLIILDEPTAALDARAEYELFETIRRLCVGRTVLFVSHRFSGVRSADHIYVLKDGVVIESGDHSELVTLGGLYAELYELQAAAFV